MKFYICRDIACDESRFVIKDGSENDVIFVLGRNGRAGERISAFDNTNKCVFKIASIPAFGNVFAYNVVTADAVLGVVIKHNKDEFRVKIHGKKLFIRGDLKTRAYDIFDVSNKVLATHRPVAGKYNDYEFNINDSSLSSLLFAIAVCADLLGFTDSVQRCRA